MKIIFLDIDGVLNSMNGLFLRGGQSRMDLYTEHMQVLRWILDRTDARIVVSSTWRLGRSVEDLKQLFYNYGLQSRFIIDKTPYLSGEQRGVEIKQWLDENGEAHEVESFVVIDDDDDMDVVRDNFVQTNHDYGLTYVEAHTVLGVLNGKEHNEREFLRIARENEAYGTVIHKRDEVVK
jgi:hypothetical protein